MILSNLRLLENCSAVRVQKGGASENRCQSQQREKMRQVRLGSFPSLWPSTAPFWSTPINRHSWWHVSNVEAVKMRPSELSHRECAQDRQASIYRALEEYGPAAAVIFSQMTSRNSS